MTKNRLAGPIIAIVISIAFVLWMISGSSDEGDTLITKEAPVKSLIPKVQVVTSQSTDVTKRLSINGVLQANRNVTVRSETTGKVVEILKNKGDSVAAGEVIARIDAQDIPIRIEQAKSFEQQALLEYDGAKKLKKQGLQNDAQLAAAATNYAQAKAQLKSLTLQLSQKSIRSPFTGQVETSHIELGSFVLQNTPIVDVYDYSSIKFVGTVSEKDIASVHVDQPGIVKLIDGTNANAMVSYIGSVANEATRTFTIELTMSDVARKVSGVTSVAHIELDKQPAHYVSPALLSINDLGQTGLKTLNDSNIVEFNEVKLVNSNTGGVWVSGLPSEIDIIIVGQGYVNTHEKAVPIHVEFNPNVAVGL